MQLLVWLATIHLSLAVHLFQMHYSAAFFARKCDVSFSSIYYISQGKDFSEFNVIQEIHENAFYWEYDMLLTRCSFIHCKVCCLFPFATT